MTSVKELESRNKQLARIGVEMGRLQRKQDAAWWALVMGAAAALEDAANCLSDPDAKRAAEGAAKRYRTEANALWPNV